MKLHWKAKAQGMQFTHRYKQQDLKAKFILNCWSSWSFQYTSSYRMFSFIGWDSFSALLEALSVTECPADFIPWPVRLEKGWSVQSPCPSFRFALISLYRLQSTCPFNICLSLFAHELWSPRSSPATCASAWCEHAQPWLSIWESAPGSAGDWQSSLSSQHFLPAFPVFIFVENSMPLNSNLS